MAPSVTKLIDRAHADLARGDGIAAEIDLRKALDAGAPREAVAARMGEAMLDQGLPDKAREWLGTGQFAPSEALHGFRMLGRLERLDGNLAAAGHAYDRALAIDGNDADLWVDIGRLRYAGGEHMPAIEAADHALTLDPANTRALEFRGEIVRDQYGLAAALPWFEAALAHDPDNLQVLGEYAATLGDLDRAKDMLAASRHMLQLDSRNARALYLQAVLAARAGDNSLARSLLDKIGDRFDNVPGAMLLDAVLNLRSGNYLLATETLEKLVARQPDNMRAQELLAAAYYGAGSYSEVARRFDQAAGDGAASSYLLTTVARAHEMLGERDRAAPLLDRAAKLDDRMNAPVGTGSELGAMLLKGDFAEAEASAEKRRAASPGNADAQALAGDVQLAENHAAAAFERYRLASRVRMSDSLMARTAMALVNAGHGAAAKALVESFLAQNPSSRNARRLVAALAARQGDWARAAQLLGNLNDSTGGGDVRLLADLSLAQLRSGNAGEAEKTAAEAYRLQPASAVTAQAWGMALAALGQRKQDARALLDKARAIGGDNPMLAEARKQLGG
jgi:tetratricopeptide (TPR) repeat protein